MDKWLIKTPQQIANIRESGKYLNELLLKLKNEVQAGMSLLDLELFAEQFISKNNLKGAFKWYQWFPANLCLSVNDCVVHWIPDNYILKNWDLLKIDSGVIYNKWISDSAISIVVGGDFTNPLGAELVDTTKLALDLWLKELWPNKSIYNYAKTIFNTMEKNNFKIIKTLTWHGVGNKVHERPYIYNHPHPETKHTILYPGMVVALEPITAIKSTDVILKWNNDRNLYCNKWDLWAQWEYMVLITENWYEILSGITKI